MRTRLSTHGLIVGCLMLGSTGWQVSHNSVRAEEPTPIHVLVTSMLPADNPKQETLVWAVDRVDGGRGVGAVVPHYFQNWRNKDLRKMILNAICWTAKIKIPADGVDMSGQTRLLLAEAGATDA